MDNIRSDNKFKFDLLAARGNKCANCGSTDNVAIRLIVPEKVGGTYVDTNIVVLCRPCDMALDASSSADAGRDRRSINIWVSAALYSKLQQGIKNKPGFSSMGSLVRYLINKYIEDPSRFCDLEQFQSVGSDSKINIWVETENYNKFKDFISARGCTVTDALKSLIAIYESEAETLLR